jgi:hypothetical protein
VADEGDGADAPKHARLASPADLVTLMEVRGRNVVPIDQPLVLISQTQRSGGSLLSQLFDGHPAVHTHPYELKPGREGGDMWPMLAVRRGAKAWWRALYEAHTRRMFEEGYRKEARKDGVRYADEPERPALPFLLPPSFQRSLFHALVESAPPTTNREVLDRYFTSYFNAWLDYQGLHGPPKRWVVAFRPRMAWGASRRRFMEDYADGRLVSSIRDPKAWYASLRQYRPKRYAKVEPSLLLWKRGAREVIEAMAEAPDRVDVVRFEDLVGRTEATMRALCARLELDFDPILLEPTFNRMAVRANSSFAVHDDGVLPSVLETYKSVLTEEEQALIDDACGELHAEAAALALAPYEPEPEAASRRSASAQSASVSMLSDRVGSTSSGRQSAP